MSAAFKDTILSALKQKFRFKKVGSKWLQEGQCPDCNDWELFTAAVDPKVVTCGRMNNCGYQESVRDVLPDLFEDWSERFKPSEQDPNATADAYLRECRGLDVAGLRGHFSQEHYFDKGRNAGSATVRFPLPGDGWWERIIDRPGRFDKKARFKFGTSPGGHCWVHPNDSFADLALMDQIWIGEGIFDAMALRQNFQRLQAHEQRTKCTAVSAMSCNYWPEHFLAELRKAIAISPDPKHRPTLVFAFDVGFAGVRYTREFVARARREGWDAGAAQLRADGEGEKQDWNDLWLRQQAHKADGRTGPLSSEKLDEYRWNGDVTIAETAQKKARLIHDRKHLASFDFRFDNKLYWARAKSVEDGGTELIVDEVANCAFRILYRERDEIIDETNYFLEVVFPNKIPTAKARFSSSCCATGGEFKKRLFAFGGIWAGSQEQLDRLMRSQTRFMKTVEPLHFTGYSEAHNAWVLGDLAVHDGRVIKLGSERYFDLGKSAFKLRSEERILSIQYLPDDLDLSWIRDLWEAWGERGIAVLAFFTLSLFAVQVRNLQQSVGFLELHGEPGSGKSTLIEFMWKLLGRDKFEGSDPNSDTKAAVYRQFTQVSNLPVGLIESTRDENKSSHQARFDWQELLKLFNGRSPRATGQKNNGTETFSPPFLGSIYLMQNNPIEASPAVMERVMSMRIGKDSWSGQSKPAATRIARWNVAKASGWIIHVTRQADKFLPFFFDRFEHHEKAMPGRVAGLENGRIIKNHSQLAAAVDTLRNLIPANLLPDEWLQKTIGFIDFIAREREDVTASEHPVVRKFWEIYDYLCAVEVENPENPINMHRNQTDLIAINMPRFMEACRARGQVPPTDEEVRKHLKGSKARKYLGQRTVNPPNGKGLWCWVFQRPLTAAAVI